jgi:autotransporter-associated beta strand protein
MNGGQLAFDPNVTTVTEPLSLNGSGPTNAIGALVTSGDVDLEGNILLTGPTTINTVGSGSLITSPGVISGTGPFTKFGLGTLYLIGSLGNTYSGDTLASEGVMLLAKTSGSAVPNHLVVGTVTKANPFGTTANVTLEQSYEIDGSTVTVNDGSEFDLAGNNESIPELILNGGADVQTASGTLRLTGVSGTVVSDDPGVSGAAVISGNLSLFAGGTFDVGTALTSLNIAPPLNIQANLSEFSPGDIVKTGLGELRFSSSNSFAANVDVNQGTLSLANNYALSPNPGLTTVNGNGTLELLDGVTINGQSLALNSLNPVALLSSAGSNTWSGTILLNRTSGIEVDPTNGYLQALNTVSGPGGITKTGLGTLQFWGSSSNSYSGLTLIENGAIEGGRVGLVSIPGDVVVGDNSTTTTVAALRSLRDAQINREANITLNSSGALNLINVSSTTPPIEHVATLNGAGTVNLELGTALVVSNIVSCTFSGPMNGPGRFSKNGPAAMTVLGNWNLGSFFTSSALDIFEGDLIVQGSIISETNAVLSGGRLRGSGHLSGPVGVASGGAIAVNPSAPGRQGGSLELGALTLHSGATVSLNIFGPSSNGGNDELIVDGPVNLASATLSTSIGYPPRAGDVITQINKTASGQILNFFTGWSPGNARKVGNYTVIPSYTGGDGNDFTLTITNVPVAYFSYRLADGNGNQTVEPDECNLLYVSLLNPGTNSLTITNAVIRATNSIGVVVTIAQAAYPVISAGQTAENLTPFQFATDTNLPCGGAVGFELVVGVAGQGQFAIDFNPVSGTDCSHPTGPCDSCTTASGQFTAGTLTTTQPIYFFGAPSICYPPKAYPGTNPAPMIYPVPYLTHNFTNPTTNTLCVTAELDFNCPAAPANSLGVAAYLGVFDPNNPSINYLGDIGQGGPPYPAFSFQVPPQTNFTLVVMAQVPNLACSNYSLQLFGLPCPPPRLAIEPDAIPTKLKVDWSTAYPGWTAQQEGNLTGVYSNVAQLPAIINGRYAITNISPITNQFYRLKQ